MSLKVNRGRTLARSQALQILFQAEMRGERVDTVLAGDMMLSKGPLADYAIELARGVDANRERIDSALRAVSTNWALDRMPGADRNLLRLAVYELRFLVEDPLSAGIVINEAVEVAKAYGTDESAGFVNGVLGRIEREQVLPSLMHSGCTITAEDCEAACIAALWFEIDPARARASWDDDASDAEWEGFGDEDAGADAVAEVDVDDADPFSYSDETVWDACDERPAYGA